MNRDIDERAFRLALHVITLRRDDEYQQLVRWKVLGQPLRAVTSVGANLAEAAAAQTKADFVAKVSIAKKEAFEAQYWLRLVEEGGVLSPAETTRVRGEAADVGRIVSAIARRAKSSDRRDS
jgi:four helix bundle protein